MKDFVEKYFFNRRKKRINSRSLLNIFPKFQQWRSSHQRCSEVFCSTRTPLGDCFWIKWFMNYLWIYFEMKYMILNNLNSLPIWVPPRYCKCKFLHTLMKIIGQIYNSEFFMHMSDSYPEKMEGSILISCPFIRRRLNSLVFI